MSNIEHRLKNEEVGIRNRTGILLDKRLGTWYFVLGTILLMSNIEHRLKNEEVGIRNRTGILLDKRLGT
jgi:hypothetical protein